MRKAMAESYKNLKVWQDAMKLARMVYASTQKFPKEEMFGMTSQLRRASVSISSNIAEGSSRKSRKDYIRFIDIAIGSCNEVESLLALSQDLGFILKSDCDDLLTRLASLGKTLNGFRRYLGKANGLPSALRSPHSAL